MAAETGRTVSALFEADAAQTGVVSSRTPVPVSTSPAFVQVTVVAEKLGYWRPTWRQRHFVLSEGRIEYFASAPADPAGKPKGVIRLAEGTTLNLVQGGVAYRRANAHKGSGDAVDGGALGQTLEPKPNLLEIADARDRGEAARTFYLSFETDALRQSFAVALASSLAAVRGASS